MNVEKILGLMFIDYGAKSYKDRLVSYCLEFASVKPEVLKVAVQRCERNCKFPPTKAEIYAELEQVKQQVDGEDYLSWDKAWQEIQNNMARVGPYQHPEWSTPEIAQAVKSIGWQNLCATEARDEPIVRAQMRNIYMDICKRTASKEQTKNILEHKTGFEGIGDIAGKLLGGKQNGL